MKNNNLQAQLDALIADIVECSCRVERSVDSSLSDCRHFFERLFEFVDCEMPSIDADEMLLHVEQCAPCLDKIAAEMKIRQLLKRSCCEKAPEELQMRIMQVTVQKTGNMEEA